MSFRATCLTFSGSLANESALEEGLAIVLQIHFCVV